jgi:D-alanyl-lipoteichoic acid acyltransferase DltB (MBOAT superfamily)
MLFNSYVYFAFLTLVVIVYWRLSWRQQNVFLLVASYFFYGWWDWRFLSLMLASTLVDYYVAHGIAGARDPAARKRLLAISMVLNFAFLGFFKYFNFFVDSAVSGLSALGLQVHPTFLQIILPPGISFYTFQAVAYVVDVYKGDIEPSESLIDYALFISLFPHLIAGPIQRPSHLLPQTHNPRRFDGDKFFDGMCLIASGLFRKCVIADNCAILANAAFDGQWGYNTVAVLIGVYAFAWQIYGDFSAYSDFARGSAQLLGFHFMVNFRQPYLSESLQDFWRRWHISLSTWLRDYLYIPLGGNRKGPRRTYVNLMTTMVLGGLWHGANWTFVIWGAMHGAGLAVERFVMGRTDHTQSSSMAAVWFRRAVIFHLVCLTWIFFRAQSVTDAFTMLAGLGNFQWSPAFVNAILLLAVLALIQIAIDLRLENSDEEYIFERRPQLSRVAIGLAGCVLVFLFAAGESNAFIYFQF